MRASFVLIPARIPAQRSVRNSRIWPLHSDLEIGGRSRRSASIDFFGSRVRIFNSKFPPRSHDFCIFLASLSSSDHRIAVCPPSGPSLLEIPSWSPEVQRVRRKWGTLKQDFPAVASYWDPFKNGNLNPSNVSSGSGRAVWWQCPKDANHRWLESIVRAVRRKHTCRKCYQRSRSLPSLYPEMALQWHPTLNGNINAADVFPGSHRLVWWQCTEDPTHLWQARLHLRTSFRTGCPWCANLFGRVSRDRSLAAVHPGVAAEFHPTLNNVTAWEVAPGSSLKYWWQCPRALSHQWQASVSDRVARKNDCPKCRIQKFPPGTRMLEARPDLVNEYDLERNTGPAEDLSFGMRTKVWWQCLVDPTHHWQAAPANRVRGQNCPYCAGRYPSATNNLLSKFPEVAEEWHATKNGTTTPQNVLPFSEKPYWFECGKCGYEWKSRVDYRTRGRGCPECARTQRWGPELAHQEGEGAEGEGAEGENL